MDNDKTAELLGSGVMTGWQFSLEVNGNWIISTPGGDGAYVFHDDNASLATVVRQFLRSVVFGAHPVGEPGSQAEAAVRTLSHLGWSWSGGLMWQAPVERAPEGAHVGSAADSPLETSEDEAQPYVAPTFHWGAPEPAGKHFDVNALERMARQRPDDCFLKGSGILKLTGAIRQLEAQIAELQKGHVPEMSAAARDVLAERRRQQEVEGWTPEHDDQYHDCALAEAAICYAQGHMTWRRAGHEQRWPWARVCWKPSGYRNNLKKAGALILAEIERLDRAAEKGGAA
ncbi:hypothetical protein [Herbaspirillum frisingense]|uniref:hypothetical protein n=1 Tax=Herbaspirillum frisingense TaxID=92645 RepID=UPI0039B0700D